MLKKAILLILISALGVVCISNGQSPEKQQAINAMRTLADKYKSYKKLGFLVSYRYAAAANPGLYLDSLQGKLEMSGSRYRYVLDSTEFIVNDSLSVVLFKQDHIMYLAKSMSSFRTSNPMAMLDSLLVKGDSIECRLGDWDGGQRITLDLARRASVRRIEYFTDRHSGLLVKMICTVPSRELYDPSVRSIIEPNESYALIETDFRDYREGGIEENKLALSNYFRKDGDRYIAVAPYETYKIFLGSPDLP